jgi:hypothetical protein
MADLSVTAANVVKGSTAEVKDGIAAVTITAGQVLYADASDGFKLKLAQCDTTAAEAAVVGIALNGGSANQPIRYITRGKYNPGGTVTIGIIYALSAAAGAIAPNADLTTGNRVTVLGIGTTASEIDVQIHVSGVAKP